MSIPPAAYAPFDSPEAYILGCTDEIWTERGVGLIAQRYYREDVVVHGGYGTVYGVAPVVASTLQSLESYPDEVGRGEAVLVEARGEGFVSSHRVYSTGTNLGWSVYGPPTGRPFEKRAVAHCLVEAGQITREWVVRDEARVPVDLGVASAPVVERLAAAGVWSPLDLGPLPDQVSALGVSGGRPGTGRVEEIVLTYLDTVWNEHRLDLAPRFVDPAVVLHAVGGRTRQGLRQWGEELLGLLGTFPGARLDVLDLVARAGDSGDQVAVVWLLRGRYDGNERFGPVTGEPVEVLGCSHLELVGDRVVEEYRVYDELAVAVQIEQGRRSAART